MSVFPPNRYHEIEPARVQHGRSFVQAHQPASVTVATARSLHARPLDAGAQARAGGGVLPPKAVTLSSSMRGAVAGSSAGSVNTTRIDARGHTLQLGRGGGGGANQSQQWLNQSQMQMQGLNQTAGQGQGQGGSRSGSGSGPLPSHALHPNHITDVFPDALSALAKTEEHSYAASVRQDHSHSHANHSSSNGHNGHNPYVSANPSHHKVPLRMPVGPSAANQHQQQGQGGSGSALFEGDMSGMDDSVYAQVNQSQLNGTTNGSGGGGVGSGPTPLLSAALASDRVVPLQRENLRLVRSNNALQAHLVAEGERIDEKEKSWAAELRNVKTKYTDLQFLHAQKTRKIANQETKISELQQRLEQVLSDRAAYVKESIEVSSRLEPGVLVPSPTYRAPGNPATVLSNSEVDLMRQHEAKLAELSAELAAYQSRAAEFESERATLQSKVVARDSEVKRLSEVIESERNWDKMQAEAELKKLHKHVQKLEGQLDYLNGQRTVWERDAASFREMGVSAQFVAMLEESRAQTAQARHEADQSGARVKQLQEQLEAASARAKSLEESQTGVDARVHQAVAQAERDARAEIAALQSSYSALQSRLDQSEQDALDAQSRTTSLEHELHLLASATGSKAEQLASKETLLSHHAELISKLNAQVTELRGVCRAVETQKNKVEAEWRLGRLELEQTKAILGALQEQTTAAGIGLQDKGQEVVSLREQATQLIEEKHALELELSARDTRISTLQSAAHQSAAEQEAMKASLQQADEVLEAVQDQVEKLRAEREGKEQAYANLYADYTDVCTQLSELRGAKFPNLQAQMAQLRAEKDRLATQLQHVQTDTVGEMAASERQAREEVVRLQSMHTELLGRLEQEQERTADAAAHVTQLEQELHSLRQATSTKSSQLSSNQSLLAHHTDLISKLNLQVTDLKSLARGLETQRNRLENEWKHSQAELDKARQALAQHVDLHTNQSMLLTSKSQEVVELKAQLSALGEEVALQSREVSARDARIDSMQAELDRRDEGAKQLSSLVDEGAASSSALQDALRQKEYELADLGGQLAAARDASQKLQEENALKSADLKSILGDLESILKENQLLSREVASLRTGAESRGLDAERAATRAAHAEELYRAKEGECMDLLSNYRTACLELERHRLAGEELERERGEHRAAIKSQSDRLYAQEAALKAAESELRARMLDLHSGEEAIQELGRALESQKRALDSLHDEKRELQQALDAARMVAQAAEQSRGEQGRTVAEGRSALAKAQIDQQALAMDNAHLGATLAQAREHASNLEGIISSLRAQAHESSESAARASADKNARISQLQQELQQTRIGVDTMQEQIKALDQYREKQNSEINRLLQSLASSPASGGSGKSNSGNGGGGASSEFLAQLQSLQGVIDSQFARLQELQKEKAKLKGYICKYEAELRSWEKRGAPAHSPRSPATHSSPHPPSASSAGASPHAAAAAGAAASSSPSPSHSPSSALQSPGQPSPPPSAHQSHSQSQQQHSQQQQQQPQQSSHQQQQQYLLQHSMAINQSSASFHVHRA